MPAVPVTSIVSPFLIATFISGLDQPSPVRPQALEGAGIVVAGWPTARRLHVVAHRAVKEGHHDPRAQRRHKGQADRFQAVRIGCHFRKVRLLEHR